MRHLGVCFGSQPACAGFEKAGDMLTDDGFELPIAAPAADQADAASAAASSSAPNVPGLNVPGLQLSALGIQPAGSSVPSYLGTQSSGATSPHISPHLPTSPHISTYLHISPHISLPP